LVLHTSGGKLTPDYVKFKTKVKCRYSKRYKFNKTYIGVDKSF
jgi:hypothetical protein